MVVFFRTAIENNEQHEVEVASSRAVAEEDASNSSKDIAQGIESTFLALICSS
jgi:kinesin family protein 11